MCPRRKRGEQWGAGVQIPYPTVLWRTLHQDLVYDESGAAHKDDHGVSATEADLPRLRFYFLEAPIVLLFSIPTST